MPTSPIDPASRKPLRLWPALVVVVLQWLVWLLVPLVSPDAAVAGVLGGFAGGVVILLWWLFFSRAPWSNRLGAPVLMVVAVLATYRVVHPSIANGMMGMMLVAFSIPLLSLALVAWAVASRRLSTGRRRASLVGAIMLACGVMTLVRTDGMRGAGASDLHWRWTPTPEQRLLAQVRDDPAGETPTAPLSAPTPAATPEKPRAPQASEPLAAPAAVAEDAITTAEWPGFRGPERDGIIRGVHIATDWSRSAPIELWRRPIGPGWSSFAVRGNLIYTQEQRGDAEIVSCYNLTTGAPVWRHRDATRFWESNGGAGPRGTPTLSNGRVYTFGATGILNALDARTGAVIWTRHAASDTNTTTPMWGFAGSPLVVGDKVVVATSGALVAYDSVSGNPRWFGPAGAGGYSSPQIATIDGVEQIVLLNGGGATSVAPADGKVLWTYAWPGDGIVQPAVIAGTDVLIGSGSGMGEVGVRRISVAHGSSGWTAEERWTSSGLKPYFNDFVVHKGYAYGFDGGILACIDLNDGTRKWKGGRYGHGQLVGLPDQDLLLLLSEEGELALVKATPDRFEEIARVPAIEGKTWNHPVLVRDVLLVRNGEQMAAFRVSLAAR